MKNDSAKKIQREIKEVKKDTHLSKIDMACHSDRVFICKYWLSFYVI